MSVDCMDDKKPVPLSELAARVNGGLRCPTCGCSQFWSVSYTRARDGYILRKRQCRGCGKHSWTKERIATSE